MKSNQKIEQYIFLYGTLKREFHHEILNTIADDVEYVGETLLHGKMYDIGEYPGAIPDDKAMIKGDVFRLIKPRKVISVLDEYEGYYPRNLNQSEYLRRKEKLKLKNSKKIDAWIYWYNNSVEGKKLIRHRDYINYINAIK